MIGREELRRILEQEGHDPETIDKVLAWYYGTHVDLDALAAALEQLKLEMAEAVQRMADLWEQLTGAGAGQPLQGKEKPRRPPRRIGPKNRTAERAQRPARMARPGWPGQAAGRFTNKTKPEALSLRLFFLKISAFYS